MSSLSRIKLPPLTRALLAVILISSTLNAYLRFRKWNDSISATPDTGKSTSSIVITPSSYLSEPKWAIPFLVLIPVYSLRYPWTFLTAALVENNLVSLSISGAVVWFGGRYLERSWGGKEFGKFVLFVTMLPNLGAFFIYALWHGLFGTPTHPYPVQGLVALEAGFLVALKQLVPEHTVSLLSNTVRVRLKHFPALFTLANIISGPLLGTWTALWLSSGGFLTSWIYLRFFRLSEAGGEGEGVVIRGDASDTFSFVAFFPDALHPFLTPISDGIFGVLVKAGIPFASTGMGDLETGNTPGASGGNGDDGSARAAEAERRRALALKALDERLSAATRAAGTSTEPATSSTETTIASSTAGKDAS